jgi:uncharacterized repeat protein (TIGR01451 family)
MLRSALTRGALSAVAAVAAALCAAPAALASVTIGQTGNTSACSSDQVMLQWTTNGAQSYAAPSPGGVVVSWSYQAGAGNAAITFKVYHTTLDAKIWFVRAASVERLPGSNAGQVKPNTLNTFAELPGLPIQTGDVLGLTGRTGTAVSCISTTGPGSGDDQIRVKNPPDPPPGAESGGFLGSLSQLRLGVSAVIEPDADGDTYGDETQDGCTTDPAVHSTGCPVDVQIVKNASPDVTVGDDITYTLAVKNNHATATAPSVTVTDALPSSLTFVAASAAQGSCSGSTTVTCAIGSLGPGQSTTATIVAKTTVTGPVTNTADVSTSVPDTSTTNNSSSFTTQVNEVQPQPQPPTPPPAPVLSPLKLSPAAFKAAKSGPPVATGTTRGTILSYTVSEAATSTFRFKKGVRGVKKGRKCVAPPKKKTRKKPKRCTRYVGIAGTFTHADAAGPVAFRFTGRLGGRTLKPARYKVSAVARNVTGASAPVGASFRVKKG